MDYDLYLGVWQNDYCIRCGGCCFVCATYQREFYKPRDTLCERLVINPELNNTSCILRGQPDQPELCQGYSCWVREDYSYRDSMGVYQRLLIARAVLDVLKIEPVKNAQNIRDFLEILWQKTRRR